MALNRASLMVRPRPSRIQAGVLSGFLTKTCGKNSSWTNGPGGAILGLPKPHENGLQRAITMAITRPASASTAAIPPTTIHGDMEGCFRDFAMGVVVVIAIEPAAGVAALATGLGPLALTEELPGFATGTAPL